MPNEGRKPASWIPTRIIWSSDGKRGCGMPPNCGGNCKRKKTIRERGGRVGLWAAAKRKAERGQPEIPPTEATPVSPWSAKRASWLIFGEESELSDADWQAWQRMHQVRPELFLVQALTHDFLKMVRQRQPEKLTGWLEQVKEAKITSMESFGLGIQQDLDAVKAALSHEWSNGQTEGQVNRLKMIKRQMYGRAEF